MITKGVLFHQDIASAHSSVVAMAPVVPGSPMGLDLVSGKCGGCGTSWKPQS